jgi:TPR repeat protein
MAQGKGCVEAAYNQGVLFAGGKGVPADPVKAKALFEKAAKAGVAKAAFNLGVMAATGQGGNKDLKLAAQWMAAAATLGDPRAAAKAARGEKGLKETTAQEAYQTFILTTPFTQKEQQPVRSDADPS